MVAKIKTFSFSGIEVEEVDVEVKISKGRHRFNIVGLGDKAVAESKERVWSAICSIGLSWPYNIITVNLSPADLKKEGSHYDLAIVLALMIEMEVIKQADFDDYYVLGEVSLDGSINSVNGIISAAIGANQRNKGIICPKVNGKEAAWAGNLNIIAIDNILQLLNHIRGLQILERPETTKINSNINYPDLIEVKGQELAKRALEIAASGGHNLLMIGPPGTGKSMLASRLPSILPDLTLEEILEVNMIQSVGGNIKDGKLIINRPFIEVHHSCSMPAMVGGGQKARPGEVSLAHKGVLFLDELAEFPRQVLDSLRQPIETGEISISRVNCHVTYPADFQLIAAMNPCKCGFLGDVKKQCHKAPDCGLAYKSKISGPLLDRFDLVVYVSEIDIINLRKINNSEASNQVKDRVIKTRNLQSNRYLNEGYDALMLNSKINSKLIEKYCDLDDQTLKILDDFIIKKSVSMRGMSRILRVARTIADMSDCDKILKSHLLEAISYRQGI